MDEEKKEETGLNPPKEEQVETAPPSSKARVEKETPEPSGEEDVRDDFQPFFEKEARAAKASENSARPVSI